MTFPTMQNNSAQLPEYNMEPTAPQDDDPPAENLVEKNDGKTWKKADDIPLRFDELPTEEDDWIPVASVIRAQREEIAKREAQEIKIKPPLELDIKSPNLKSKHKNPAKQHLELKKDSIKEENKIIQTKEDANMSPEILNEDKNESDENIDAVTRAMIDWGLKTSVTYDPKKRSKASINLDQPSYQNSFDGNSSSNVGKFPKAPSDNYKKSYESEHASISSNSTDDKNLHHDYNRQEKLSQSTDNSSSYYERAQTSPEYHKDPISDRRSSYYDAERYTDPISDRRSSYYDAERYTDPISDRRKSNYDPRHQKDPTSDRRNSYYDPGHHRDPISDRRKSYYDPGYHKDPISDRRNSYYDPGYHKDPISDRRNSYYDPGQHKDATSDRRYRYHDPELDQNRGYRQDPHRNHRQYGDRGQAHPHEPDPYYNDEHARSPRQEYEFDKYEHNKHEQYDRDKHGYSKYPINHPNYDRGHDQSHYRGHDLGY
nr:uncharacterized protein LOC123745332 isoform X1 [Procambarus clarkii]